MKEKEKTCNCDETCDCGCTEEKTCNCDETCDCGCTEGKECNCDEACECNHDDKKKHKKDKYKEQINSLETEIQNLKESSLRDKAEMINYRKRKDDDVARLLKFSNEDLITEMLPIIDTFEHAIKMDDDNLDDEVSKFLSGFKMVYCNLTTVLEKYGVKIIDGNNKPFDPSYHQAVMTEKCDMESGMVIEVLRKGYILKDKVIRPAMVKVSE